MKKVLILFLAFLTLLAASPVMAIPKTKSSFESHVTLVAGNVSMGQQQITQDGMMYVYGAISTGSISGSVISGSLWTDLSGSGNLTAGQGFFQGKYKISSSTGDFEGNVRGVITVTNPDAASVSGSFVGFGTGGYAQQKIKGTFEGNVAFGFLQVQLDMIGVLTNRNA